MAKFDFNSRGWLFVDIRKCDRPRPLVEQAYELLADDVLEEFEIEGVIGKAEFVKDVLGADNVRFLYDENGRFMAGFWGVTAEAEGSRIRVFGCVVRGRAFAEGDMVKIAKATRPALVEFAKTEPKWANELYVCIPQCCTRLRRHAREIAGVDEVKTVDCGLKSKMVVHRFRREGSDA